MSPAGMTQEAALAREEPIRALGEFSQALTETLARAGMGADLAWEARGKVLAECIQCGMQVSGEELFALSQPEPEKETNAKVRRLRLGDCSRPGCESYHYRVIFQPCPGVDWTALVPQIEKIKRGLATHQAAPTAVARRRARWGMVRRAGIALTIVLLVLIMRQWYSGGRIPWIREPEKFRVDPYPPGYQPPQ